MLFLASGGRYCGALIRLPNLKTSYNKIEFSCQEHEWKK